MGRLETECAIICALVSMSFVVEVGRKRNYSSLAEPTTRIPHLQEIRPRSGKCGFGAGSLYKFEMARANVSSFFYNFTFGNHSFRGGYGYFSSPGESRVTPTRGYRVRKCDHKGMVRCMSHHLLDTVHRFFFRGSIF